MRLSLTLLFLLLIRAAFGQYEYFPFGQATYTELGMKTYEKDTSAAAVVIRELGYSYIDNGNEYNLIHRYHVKIKILKPAGLARADVAIPLYQDNGKSELIRGILASSFTLQNGSMIETKLSAKNIYTENHKYGNLKKFSIPNVIVGSVIEYQYEIETPFFSMNFKPWEFQSDIPKMWTEYWATIPGNYRYNISLRGFHKLKKEETELKRACFSIGGGVADCVSYQWAMENVPAFVEEEYMTARKNFLSAIQFELTEIKYFNGRVDRVTKEWKDADKELRTHDGFGVQLKKGKDVANSKLDLLVLPEKDPLKKAHIIYDFIRSWYRWDGKERFISSDGIKKAFESRSGNSADINLSLIAALRHYGLTTDPVILSTRDNGLATDLFPVLSEFNYVIAKVDIADKSYLLDATDDYLPFGTLPERCLNGKGRVMNNSNSYWLDIHPNDKARKVVMVNLKLSSDGSLSGKVQTTYLGYRAAEKRSLVNSFTDMDQYISDRKNKWVNGVLNNVVVQNLDDFTKPLVEILEVDLEHLHVPSSGKFLFNPFLFEKISVNPFRSTERLYPVDFGVPLDETVLVNLELPDGVLTDELPEPVGVALPNNGGRYIFRVEQRGNVLSINTALSINRTVFSSEEYHYLKELFNKVVSVNRMDLVMKKI